MPTQRQIAEHLDISQQQVSELLAALQLESQTASMDQIRVAYLARLRRQAAAQRTAGGDSLIAERVKTERVSRELLTLQLEQKRAALINVRQFEPLWLQMVEAFRVELMRMTDELKVVLDAAHGIDIDDELVHAHVRSALSQLSRFPTASDAPPETPPDHH